MNILNMNKKKRSDAKKLKRKANKKLKRKYLWELRTQKSVYQCLEEEINCLRQKLKFLTDSYEEEKKIYEECIMFKEQCLKLEFPKLEKEAKEILPSGNSFLRRDNEEVELPSPMVVKEEYVEYETYVENETAKSAKSEPIDQSKFKKEPLVAFKKSE